MEGLAPPLKCLLDVQLSLDNGASVRSALRSHCRTNSDSFARFLSRWLFRFEQGGDYKGIYSELESPYRRTLLEVFELGLRGEPILERLRELQLEITTACQSEIDAYMSRLPLITMVPLMFLQFPAFVILLVGPILANFLQGLNS